MRYLLTILLSVTLCFGAAAQNKATGSKTSTQSKQQSKQQPKKSTSSKKSTQSKSKKSKSTAPAIKYVPSQQVKDLRGEQAQIQAKINAEKKKLDENKADVAKKLDELALIGSDIEAHQANIDNIQAELSQLDENIKTLQTQLNTLQKQFNERKAKYAQSVQHMRKHGKIQDKLMFIFSAKDLPQMYRRVRFVREYAAFQKAQGDIVKKKQAEVKEKSEQLQRVKQSKVALMNRHRQEQGKLEAKKGQQQALVASLQQEQVVIKQVLDEQQKQSAELNAQIDRLVAAEMARLRAAAEAEAKKRAEAAAAEKKRREEELAKKRAAAAAAEKERQRQIAEAKAREAKAREEARQARIAAEKAKNEKEAAAKAEAERKAAEAERKAAEAKRAEAERLAMERKAEVEKKRDEKAVNDAREATKSNDAFDISADDRKLSSAFASNRGRLPMPITGSYKIVSHFGTNSVEGLKNVQLDNKGINIQGQPGCQARSIYNGEVSAVFGYGGKMAVMVRHGEYISVYFNLSSVSVSKGQKVTTNQTLGAVGSNNILQFQLRKQTGKLNPEQWLGR